MTHWLFRREICHHIDSSIDPGGGTLEEGTPVALWPPCKVLSGEVYIAPLIWNYN